MRVLGIDEAGRGPVIGPLVMCGYLIDEKKLKKLKKLGVKDSKQLTPKRRENLAPKLKKLSDDFILLKLSAKDIDKLRTTTNLNKLEIERMHHMIDLLEPDKVIIDALEQEKRFYSKIASAHNGIEMIIENFADRNYIEVAAASVIAKVHRDRDMKRLHDKYSLGTGYCSDPKTISFLKDWIKKNKEFPDFVRKSWITAQCIKSEKEQSSLMRWRS